MARTRRSYTPAFKTQANATPVDDDPDCQAHPCQRLRLRQGCRRCFGSARYMPDASPLVNNSYAPPIVRIDPCHYRPLPGKSRPLRTAKRFNNRAGGRVLAHPRNRTTVNPFFYPERVVEESPPCCATLSGLAVPDGFPGVRGLLSGGARVRDPRLCCETASRYGSARSSRRVVQPFLGWPSRVACPGCQPHSKGKNTSLDRALATQLFLKHLVIPVAARQQVRHQVEDFVLLE